MAGKNAAAEPVAAEEQAQPQQRGRRMVLDGEIGAIQDVIDVLEPLTEEQRFRVMRYVSERNFGPVTRGFGLVLQTGGDEQPIGGGGD